MHLETAARAIEELRRHPRVLRLECGVQHYPWGDHEAIPAILGRPNPRRQPFAELWAGAHPDLPAQAVVDGVRVPLDLLMQSAAKEILGPDLAERFDGELPFLLKILAAAKPLSIQAHPNRSQAVLGFERENRSGLPLDADTRNYRDPHHKPELLVALSKFYALRGFRPLAEIERTLSDTPELAPLLQSSLTDASALAALYERIMHLSQPEVDQVLLPLIERLQRENREKTFCPTDRAYWVLRAHREFSSGGRIDRGLFSIFLVNLMELQPGQAIYLPDGALHSYLQGVGIEIMANSNNVLRGGLTSKHVDPQELLRILSFRGERGELLEPETNPQQPWMEDYKTPAEEFVLSRLALGPGQEQELRPGEMRLALVTTGPANVTAENQTPLQVRPGEGLLIPSSIGCRISAESATQVWLARVPGGAA